MNQDINLKTLEIALDSDVKHTRYWTLNYPHSTDALIFEGAIINGKRVTPLKEAKLFAKKKEYTHLEIISLKRNKSNKIYYLK